MWFTVKISNLLSPVRLGFAILKFNNSMRGERLIYIWSVYYFVSLDSWISKIFRTLFIFVKCICREKIVSLTNVLSKFDHINTLVSFSCANDNSRSTDKPPVAAWNARPATTQTQIGQPAHPRSLISVFAGHPSKIANAPNTLQLDSEYIKCFDLVWFLFYVPSTHFRSSAVWSVTLTTLFLGKPPRQFTST